MMLIAAYLAPNFILWHAGSSINSINHMFGSKDHETDDNSRNNLFTGYLVWGEGWHNTHHANPSASYIGGTLAEYKSQTRLRELAGLEKIVGEKSKKLYQVDVSGLLIRLIGRFHKEN